MKIRRIFVSGYRRDLGLTRCCVASIRKWYPDIRITLVKDEIAGQYDTSDLERHYKVEVFDGPAKLYGWGMGKLQALFLPDRERILIIDSDIVFVGRVLERLEQSDADFVVCDEWRSREELGRYYFDPHVVKRIRPDFDFPGYVFNTGQIVATSGLLTQEDFAPFVSFVEPPKLLQPENFFCGEQGFLNFVLLHKAQRGELTLECQQFMRWAGSMQRDEVEIPKLDGTSPYDFMIHWFGPKTPSFPGPMKYLLGYFEDVYYQGITDGRALKRKHRLNIARGIIRHLRASGELGNR